MFGNTKQKDGEVGVLHCPKIYWKKKSCLEKFRNGVKWDILVILITLVGI